ncbi:hypothetical protein KEJ15_03770 [Candidatus Bathyarchaeota archaeon]|nr:hypothetical protein [Candidatus Bathyarchaeota archaeon]
MVSTASAIGSCDTSCFEPDGGFFRRKSHAIRPVQPRRNVSHPPIEAEGVAYYA